MLRAGGLHNTAGRSRPEVPGWIRDFKALGGGPRSRPDHVSGDKADISSRNHHTSEDSALGGRSLNRGIDKQTGDAKAERAADPPASTATATGAARARQPAVVSSRSVAASHLSRCRRRSECGRTASRVLADEARTVPTQVENHGRRGADSGPSALQLHRPICPTEASRLHSECDTRFCPAQSPSRRSIGRAR